jgi:lipopolysaccharide export LptBFGC system permease protein LptF
MPTPPTKEARPLEKFGGWILGTLGLAMIGLVFMVFAAAFGRLTESETASNVVAVVGLVVIAALVGWGLWAQRRRRYR